MWGSKKAIFQAFQLCFSGWAILHLQALLYRIIAVYFSCGDLKKCFPCLSNGTTLLSRIQETKDHPVVFWVFYSQKSRQFSWPFHFLVAQIFSFGIRGLPCGIDEPSFSTCSPCQTFYALLHQELCLRICSVNWMIILIHHHSKTDWSLLWRK